MTGPKRNKAAPNKRKGPSKRGGAKSAATLAKVGPSRPAGPSRDNRSALGRSGAKASDARTVARGGPAGLHDSDNKESAPRDSRARLTRTSQGGPAGRGALRGAPRGAAIGIDLGAPPPHTVFRDRDGEEHAFAESNLKRVAARLLSERHKPWRYRPFPFPLFNDKGNEQTFHFDFYVYDNMDMLLKLILVLPRETPEVWDKIGRFKRQYPMYSYELWTPEKLAQLQKPRAQLGF